VCFYLFVMGLGYCTDVACSVNTAMWFSIVVYATQADKWVDLSLWDFSLGHHDVEKACCLVNDIMMVGGNGAPQWIGHWSSQQER
jgi:hypothetical protein